MLVHICCSVDSHFFLKKLKELYPKKRIIGFFYDPNIHPYSEYKLRLLDVKRSCKELGVELFEGEYDYEGWLEAVRGFEDEPEKGKRCSICFDNRVKVSMQKAKELGIKEVTTTLLVSPKKSIEKLREIGEGLAKEFGLEFLSPDFRKKGGTNEQFMLARKDMLYHQNYCGCYFALLKQRQIQKRDAVELFVNIGNRVEPNSIEERIELYSKVYNLKKEKRAFEIIRESFLNYRILRAYIKRDGVVVPSYPLFYSYLKKIKSKVYIQKRVGELFYTNKDNIIFLELSGLNKMLNIAYKNIQELIYNPPKIKEEIKLREKIVGFYSLSPVVVVEKIYFDRLEVYLDAICYQDVRENLVIF